MNDDLATSINGIDDSVYYAPCILGCFEQLNKMKIGNKMNASNTKLTLQSMRENRAPVPAANTKGAFVVGSITASSTSGLDVVSLSNNPVLHTSFGAASKEAERLALIYTEKHFIVLQAHAAVKAKAVAWD